MSLPHHVSAEAAAADRGQAFGAAQADAVAVTARTYRRLLQEAAGVARDDLRHAGATLVQRLQPRWPELIAEIEGIAAGARQDPLELIAINARTELLAGAGGPECSLVGRVSGASACLVQTWDWHPDLAPARLLWTVIEQDGSWLTTATEAGIVAKLGVNSRGVACGLNSLASSADGGVGGLPIHLLLRLLLERCDGATDALALLLNARTSASACISVAVAEPDAAALFAVELSPGGGVALWPDEQGRLIHTNHFLAPLPTGVDTLAARHPGTLLRHRRLSDLLREGIDPLDALATHFPLGEPLCRHAGADGDWTERRATLLTLSIDPGRPSFRLAAGPPCCSTLEEVLLPAQPATSA